MKPLKSGRSASNWLLRLALLTMLFHVYSHTLSTWNLRSIQVIIAFLAIAGGFLMLIGGLFSKPWLTIICGLIIAGIAVYKIVISFNGTIDRFILMQFIVLALSLHFVTYGNDS